MRSLLRALARRPDPLSDAALLARYAADRDPAAFEVLVWRHGGLVQGVCRRHLRDAHAAEDAFQATFLVLARKASTVRGNTLPGFLHRVARRAAVRAAAKSRRRRETRFTADPPARPAADGELAAVLDAEIDRLPERLRQVVVLCYLDGESTEAAATRLGIPRGTVLSRLHTARATLAARLTRRGVTPPVIGLTAVLTAEQVAGGVRAAGGGVGPVTILANEVLAMSGRKAVLAAAMGLVLAGGAGTGVGVLSAQTGGLHAALPLTVADPAPVPAVVQPPANKPHPPRPDTKAALEQLNALINDAQDKIRRSVRLTTQIENAKDIIRYFEAELVRLASRRSTLQAEKGATGRRPSYEEFLREESEFTDRLDKDSEYSARTRLLGELWQQAARVEADGKKDEDLARRLKVAKSALADKRVELMAEFRATLTKWRETLAQSREEHISEAIQVTEHEIAGVNRNRMEAQGDVLKWIDELRQITPARVDDLQDELRQLRVRKVALELDGLPVVGCGESDTQAKLDILLIEVREIRRRLEAKK